VKADLQTTIREIAFENPRATHVFESIGIDYCCGGKRTLAEACRQANVAAEQVLAELQRPLQAGEIADAQWNTASLTELVDHIINKHHTFVRQESPRLTELLQKVRTRHIDAHPELNKVGASFDSLASELAFHMLKEERVLFPMIKRLEEASNSGSATGGESHCAIEFPVRQMMIEHEDAGEALSAMRSLTSGFQPPLDACPSFRALYQGLQDFEKRSPPTHPPGK
jgi:regulator of cell morphogenesis and NO signaling